MTRSNHSSLSRRSFLKSLAFYGAALPAFSGAGCTIDTSSIPPYDAAVPPEDDTLDVLSPQAREQTEDATLKPLFDSFFLGGFECSTHRLWRGPRLDMLASTWHYEFVKQDYERLRAAGLLACRDGVPWPFIEKRDGRFDFSRTVKMIRAARDEKILVIWDLFHYGWPDDLNIFGTKFVHRFARYAKRFARLLREEQDGTTPFISPINEISFLSWAGGDTAHLNPFERGRGFELKIQLVRAALAAMDEIRAVFPKALFVHCDPIINVVSKSPVAREREAAESYRLAQYQAWDMLRGDLWPQLGGAPEYVNVIGTNYYRNNQTYDDGSFIDGRSSYFRPLAEILMEISDRYYRTPILLAETGIEGMLGPQWLRYVARHVARAMRAGCPLEGITWYPVINHPGWNENRHCYNGLWDYPDRSGRRRANTAVLEEIDRLHPLLMSVYRSSCDARITRAAPR